MCLVTKRIVQPKAVLRQTLHNLSQMEKLLTPSRIVSFKRITVYFSNH